MKSILKKLNKQIDAIASEAQAKIDVKINQFEVDYDRNISHVFFEVILKKYNIDCNIIPSNSKFKFAEIL